MGLHGNEKADRLAKEAVTRVAPFIAILFYDLYFNIRVTVLASWQGR